MELKFKVQSYQTSAVKSVVDCFTGQKNIPRAWCRIDPDADNTGPGRELSVSDFQNYFKNADIQLADTQLLANIQEVQQRQNLPISDEMVSSAGCRVNLDVEMETGTGKTYCYIKTIFEMNKRYGWTKFIVVVPSIAIREGVLKSLDLTAEHFTENYGKKARFFAYNSKQLHQLESFSADAGINVMVINIQAFNATSRDNRRIYDELDDFQSRRPIDVISRNHPILILDEPQKMEGRGTMSALSKFKPLMILRYSATHRTTHNKVHRLDALDAYNQKLVKKIAVRGIAVEGFTGTNAYLYLESIEISRKPPVARIEMEVRRAGGIQRIVRRLNKGANLFNESRQLEQYSGFVIAHIDAVRDEVEFANGRVMCAGQVSGDITEATMRRIQIRETVRTHFEKEQALFPKNIKVLSLFFIDEVIKYRNYGQEDERGEYAQIFEEEYERCKTEYLKRCTDQAYRDYLAGIPVGRTHDGYFSIDKKTKKFTDPRFRTRGENAGLSDDIDAYDLILKDKVRLLSFEEPVRFIFSHSALREGWDNPNVFVMCMLKHSDNTISRRQEVGRGLRISVNRNGERMDNPVTVHDLNVLTIVANESYKDFVENLQREISDSLSRPRKADKEYFTGKFIFTETGRRKITPDMAVCIHRYLIKNDYVDNTDQITTDYYKDKTDGTLKALPVELVPYADSVFELISSVFSEDQLSNTMNDDRSPKTNPLNENFAKKEFQELWNRINRKTAYRVEFDSNELICNSIKILEKHLRVRKLTYTLEKGEQVSSTTPENLKAGKGFKIPGILKEKEHEYPINSAVRYDLLGKIAGNTHLTRRTIAEILRRVKAEVFEKFKKNPEHFIAEVSRLINEQKATIIIEKLSYNSIDQTHDVNIFTTGLNNHDLTKAVGVLKKHIYDYVIADSRIEKDFVTCLDNSEEVVVYAKLPRGFLIPTPVGDYNPDWAISFREGTVEHIYFVAETKGSMSTMMLRGIEEKKIDCARKFFEEINRKIETSPVKYDIVKSYDELMQILLCKHPMR